MDGDARNGYRGTHGTRRALLPEWQRCYRRSAGFSLIELMVAVAVVAIVTSAATPSFNRWQENQAVKEAARGIADVLLLARSEAVRSRNNHIVFFSAGAGIDSAPAGLDAGSNPLTDANGDPIPVLLINDGAPGSGNCTVDAGERVLSLTADGSVNWGKTYAADDDLAPDDRPSVSGATIPTNGVIFTAPNGTSVTWVMFRPTGVPVAFDAACNTGIVGSGGGTVYVTGGSRDYAITLSPLGGVRVHAWSGGWTQ